MTRFRDQFDVHIDFTQFGTSLNSTAIKSVAGSLEDAQFPCKIWFDLSNIEYFEYFDSLTFCSILKLLADRGNTLIVDIVNVDNHSLMNHKEYIEHRRRQNNTSRQFKNTDRVYKLSGFLDSHGFWAFLDSLPSINRIMFIGLTKEAKNKSPYYIGAKNIDSNVLPLFVINPTYGNIFKDSSRISHWKEDIDKRYWQSPAISNDEVWRIVSHELVENILQHGGEYGIIGTRIFNDCFEICVSDYGQGITSTLEEAWLLRAGIGKSSSENIEDILSYAFDEFGSSKTESLSWRTDCHALARLLRIVAKYHGKVVCRSNNWEVIYDASADHIVKNHNNLGYKPTHSKPFPLLGGTHLQVVIPLFPSVNLQRRLIPAHQPDYKLPGHLNMSIHPDGIPINLILEIGNDLQPDKFTEECRKLFAKIQPLPGTEPLFFNFDGINWLPKEFNSFLDIFANIIRFRTSVFIEMDTVIARNIRESELEESLDIVTGNRFLECIRSEYLLLLAFDKDRTPYFFGLGANRFDSVFERLLDEKYYLEELCNLIMEYVPSEAQLAAYLKGSSNIFEATHSKWSTRLGRQYIYLYIDSLITNSFEKIVEASQAWFTVENDAWIQIPWSGQWTKSFFLTTRVLEIKQYSEEIGLRLARRIELFFSENMLDMENIDCLISTTAPATLLSSIIRRHLSRQLSIVDVENSINVGDHHIIRFLNGKKCILVQDLVDTETSSEALITQLTNNSVDIVVLCSLVRFDESLDEQARFIDDALLHQIPEVKGIKHISLFSVKPPTDRTRELPAAQGERYWVEPYSLIPFKYSARLDPQKGKVDDFVQSLEELNLIEAGHFAFEDHHFIVAPKIQSLIQSPLGDKIARQIADICVDREDGKQTGRACVTDVIMPLHSNIQYLIPKIDDILHSRNLRNPRWLSIATRHIGMGKNYRLPHALAEFIKSMDTEKENNPRRILIIDDYAASGRTIETIIYSIKKAVEQWKRNNGKAKRLPIDWIGIYVIINNMEGSRSHLLNSISKLAFTNSTFFIKEYVAFFYLPIYDQQNCPECKDLLYFKELFNIAREKNILAVYEWLDKVLRKRSVLPINTTTFNEYECVAFPEGQPFEMTNSSFYTVDRALWNFHKIMNRSYPVNEIIGVIRDIQQRSMPEISNDSVISSYEKSVKPYDILRLEMFFWMFRNLQRTIVDNAIPGFVKLLEFEIGNATSVVPFVFALLKRERSFGRFQNLFDLAVDKLVSLEKSKGDYYSRVNLYIGIQLFLLDYPFDDIELNKRVSLTLNRMTPHAYKMTFSGYIGDTTKQHSKEFHALLRIMEHYVRDKESLDGHYYLGSITSKLLESGQLEAGSRDIFYQHLHLFVDSLNILSSHLVPINRDIDFDAIDTNARIIQTWLRSVNAMEDTAVPDDILSSLRMFASMTFEDSAFESALKEYRPTIAEICEEVDKKCHKASADAGSGFKLTLDIDVRDDLEVKYDTVIANKTKFIETLINFILNPAKRLGGSKCARLVIELVHDGSNSATSALQHIRFVILTDYLDFETASANFNSGVNWRFDKYHMNIFGTQIDKALTIPSCSSNSISEVNYTTSFGILVPRGLSYRKGAYQ